MAPEMPKGSRLGTEPGGWPSARPVTGIYLPITMRPADLPTNPVLATLSALSQGGGPLTSPPPALPAPSPGCPLHAKLFTHLATSQSVQKR